MTTKTKRKKAQCACLVGHTLTFECGKAHLVYGECGFFKKRSDGSHRCQYCGEDSKCHYYKAQNVADSIYQHAELGFERDQEEIRRETNWSALIKELKDPRNDYRHKHDILATLVIDRTWRKDMECSGDLSKCAYPDHGCYTCFLRWLRFFEGETYEDEYAI